ncbi:hypothetical protein Ciccas_008451, partial [Cichlidogyrus casuarinus]
MKPARKAPEAPSNEILAFATNKKPSSHRKPFLKKNFSPIAMFGVPIEINSTGNVYNVLLPSCVLNAPKFKSMKEIDEK